jgi:CDP-2,3-bis-(O-geranylgeranyl)-sn-glycerol synthase
MSGGSLLEAAWVFIPVIGAALTHAPVLRYDLFRILARPIDGGATFRGRRLLGANKTWRGAVAMASGVLIAALLLSRASWFWSRLPADVQAAGALPYGLLLALGTVVAEFPNSFLKRQLDIAPGGQRQSLAGVLLSLYDQGDFVLGVWLTLAPIWVMSLVQAVAAFVCVAVVHLLVSVIGYAIGARRTVL